MRLVVNSNPSCPVSEIWQVFCFRTSTSPPIPPEFWGVSLGLHCRYRGSEERRPKANYSCNEFRNLNYSPTYTPTVYLNVTDRQTDCRRTDTRTTYDSNTALCTTSIALVSGVCKCEGIKNDEMIEYKARIRSVLVLQLLYATAFALCVNDYCKLMMSWRLFCHYNTAYATLRCMLF